MESIGDIIWRQRQKLGLQLREVCAAAGVSKPYLSMVENDKVPPPSANMLAKLESALQFQSGHLRRRAELLRTPADVLALIPHEVVERYVTGKAS